MKKTRKTILKETIADLENAVLSLTINAEYQESQETPEGTIEAGKTRKGIENAEKKLVFLKKLYKQCE